MDRIIDTKIKPLVFYLMDGEDTNDSDDELV